MDIDEQPHCTSIPSQRGSEGRYGRRMRSFKNDDEGLTHIIEFSLSLIIVLVVLAGYFTAVDTQFIIHTPDDSKREHECIRFSEILMEDSGNAKIGSNLTTSSWETLGADILIQDLTRPGLAKEGSPFGIISLEKVEGLRNLTYKHLRSILAIDSYEFNIEVSTTNGTRLAFFGYSHDGAQKLSAVHRIVILSRGDKVETGSLTFRLFEGVNRRSLVTVNEFMYHPEDGKNEWMELYNPSDEAVDLSTLALYTYSGQTFRDFLKGPSLILPGKGYGIIIDDPETPGQYNFSRDAMVFVTTDDHISKGGLQNEGMDLFIQGETFRPYSYTYNNTLGGDGNGRSLEWSSANGGWKSSLVDEGTPGYLNSVA